jgi:hypothetical protein
MVAAQFKCLINSNLVWLRYKKSILFRESMLRGF